MTKHIKNTGEELLIKLCKQVDEILLNDKARNETVQNILEEFIDNYETKLGCNSTPLSKLLHGLKKTDATLIKMYVETVTNAKIGLNDKNRLVIKLAKDTHLETNDNYGHITWFELAKDTKTIKKDHYDNLEQALRAYKKWFEKAILTCKEESDLDELYKMMSETRQDVLDNLVAEAKLYKESTTKSE